MKPYYDDGQVSILHGDARDLDGLSADVVVTDPPYGLAFMGKAWDRVDQQFHQAWAKAAYGVLPPGGWLLAFGGTRTWHRLACGIEDAGFEMRDTIAEFGPLAWMYGSGFPKSRACLKPGWEPIIVARKPGSNVLQIDACRLGLPESPGSTPPSSVAGHRNSMAGPMDRVEFNPSRGRWPANVVLVHSEGCRPVGVRKVRANGDGGGMARSGYEGGDRRPGKGHGDPDGTETVEAWECEPECPAALLDQQSGERRSAYPGNSEAAHRYAGTPTPDGQLYGAMPHQRAGLSYADRGGSSRFFYTAKAGRSERVKVDGEQHPTVKPLSLMRWLVRLVTPPGGTVLDPFCGSGSTLVAARMEGFRAIGIEADERWCKGSAMRLREHEQGQGVLDLSG